MESKNLAKQLLELNRQPAFCVENGCIFAVNHAAGQYGFEPGIQVASKITVGKEAYEELSWDSLLLTLEHNGIPFCANVSKIGRFQVFLLDEATESEAMQALTLAATQLRTPLSSMIITADALLPKLADGQDETVNRQLSNLNRELCQMQRIVGNMADAGRLSKADSFRPEIRDVASVLYEIFQTIDAHLEHSGIIFRYRVPEQVLYCPVDTQLLERAVYNLVSNAVKYTPKGGTIECKAAAQGNFLHITVSDTGDGIPDNILDSVFTQYQRAATIEDSRRGLGLGMVLVRAAAAAHGGAVLLEKGNGTKVTMTIRLNTKTDPTLRSPVLQVDYTGGRSHTLVELADALDASHYEPKKIN